MSPPRCAQVLCGISILCSAIFIPFEIATGAYAHAAIQTGLLAAGIVLYKILARSITRAQGLIPQRPQIQIAYPEILTPSNSLC